MKIQRSSIDPFLKAKLECLRAVPPRDPLAAAQGRAAFLEQSRNLKPAVSPSPVVRPIDRKTQFKQWLQRKELKPMMTTLVSIFVVLGLLLGGGGVTASAAQDSLPDQALYQVKLWTEDLRLRLADDAGDQFNLQLQFAEQRMLEAQAMAQNGKPLPESLPTRLQNHLDACLALAATAEASETQPLLDQLRTRLQTHDRDMDQTKLGDGTNDDPLLAQVRQMIHERLRLVEDGLADPQSFRSEYQYRHQNQLLPAAEGTPFEYQYQHQNQNKVETGTPAATPGANYPGNGNSYGPGQPGYGDGECETCTPELDGNSYGPGPQQPTETPMKDGEGKSTGPGPEPTEPPAPPEPSGEPNPDPGNPGSGSGKP